MPFDPEGTGYDYESAKRYGIEPDETGHWPSRVPETGLLLKGRKHETWYKTLAGEKKAGYSIEKRDGRYYSSLNMKPEDWLDIKQSERYKGYDEGTQRLTRSKFFSDVIWDTPEFQERYPTVEKQTQFEVKFVGPSLDPRTQRFIAREEPNWIERGREAWRGQRYNMATDWLGAETTRTVLASPGGKNPEAREKFWKAREDFEEQVRTDPYAARNWFENLFHGVLGLISGVESAGEKGGLPGAIAGMAAAGMIGQVPPLTFLLEEILTVPAGATLGYTIGSTAAWMEQGTGEAYGMLVEAGVEDPLASIIAQAVGIPYGLIELAQMSRFLPTATKAIKQGILKTVIRVLKKRGIGAGVQIGQEGVQRGLVEAAVEGSKYLENEFAGKEHEFIGGKEMWNRVKEEMKQAAGPMIVLGMPGGVVEMARAQPKVMAKALGVAREEIDRVAREEVGAVRVGPEEEEAPGAGQMNFSPQLLRELRERTSNMDPRDIPEGEQTEVALRDFVDWFDGEKDQLLAESKLSSKDLRKYRDLQMEIREARNAISILDARKAEAPPAEAPGEGKQPWEMTREEWLDWEEIYVISTQDIRGGESKRDVAIASLAVRKNQVKSALAEGKPVPAHVLADYPELAPLEDGAGGVRSILEQYDSGEGDIQTVPDVADAIEALEDAPQEALSAIAKYRTEAQEDFEKLGMRGDVEQYEDDLMTALEKIDVPVAPPVEAPPAEVAVEGRFLVVGSRLRGEAGPDSDFDMVAELTTAEEEAWWAGEVANELPPEVLAEVKEGQDVFILARLGPESSRKFLFKVQEHPEVEGSYLAERVTEKAEHILTGTPKEEKVTRPFVSLAETASRFQAPPAEAAPPLTEEEKAVMAEEAGIAPADEATPLIDALRASRTWVSIEELERTMGYGREDVPRILTGRHGIFVSPRETKGAARGQLRTDLQSFDLLVESAITPGGALWEVGGQIHGVDPNVDPHTQVMEWLIEEGERFVSPEERAKKVRPPTAERILGIKRTPAEAAEYAALKREKRKEAKVARGAAAEARKEAREKAKVRAKEVRYKREEKRVDVWIAREKARETARNKLLKERGEATLERERIRQTFREKRIETAEIKKALVAYAQKRLPKEIRGRLLARVAKTRTREALVRAVDLIEKMHARAEATEARMSLVKTIKKLDTKHMRGEYRRKVEAIINKLDPSKPTEKTLTELEGTRNYLKRNPDTWIPDSEIEKLERLEKMPIADMSTKDIQLIEMSITHAVKLEKLKGKLIAAQRYRKLDEIGAKIAETAARKGKGEFEGETALLGELKIVAWGKKFWAAIERLESYCLLIDGDPNGAAQDVWYDSIDQAETERIRYREEDKEAVRAELAKRGVDLEDEFFSWSETMPKATEYVTVTLPSTDETVTMTKGQRISFYNTTQDPAGLRSLLEGGQWTLERMGQSFLRLSPDPETLAPLTIGDIDAINDSMTDQERAIAEVFSWYMNEYVKPKVNEVSDKIVGFDLLTEESYWPKTTDPTAIPVKPTDPALGMRRPYLHETVEAWGRFKPREPGAKKPLVIQDAFKLMGEHVARTGSYRAYAPALRDAKAVLNMKEVRDALNDNLGRDALRNIRTLITRVEDNSYRTGALDSFMARVHNNAVGAILIGKPVVWVRQALSYPCVYARISGLEAKHLTQQLLKPIWGKKQKTAMMAWLKQHSPQIWYRLESGKMTRDVGDMMRGSEVAGFFADYNSLREKMSFGLRSGDAWAIMRIVRAAQTQARAKLGAKAKQSEVDAYAAKLAEVAVRNTQPTWHVKDRSVIGGEPHWGWKAFTVFRSFREKLLQGQRMSWRIYLSERNKAADKFSKGEITEDQYKSLLLKNKGGVVKDLTIFFIIATLLNNMTTEIWRRLRGKKPRYDFKKPATAVFGVLKDVLASNLGHYYIIGDVLENIVKGWGEFKAFDPFRSPFIETGDRIVKFGTAVGNAIANAPIRPSANEKKFESSMSTIYRNFPVIVGRVSGIPIEGVVNIGEIIKEVVMPKKKKKKKKRRKRLKGF